MHFTSKVQVVGPDGPALCLCVLLVHFVIVDVQHGRVVEHLSERLVRGEEDEGRRARGRGKSGNLRAEEVVPCLDAFFNIIRRSGIAS